MVQAVDIEATSASILGWESSALKALVVAVCEPVDDGGVDAGAFIGAVGLVAAVEVAIVFIVFVVAVVAFWLEAVWLKLSKLASIPIWNWSLNRSELITSATFFCTRATVRRSRAAPVRERLVECAQSAVVPVTAVQVLGESLSVDGEVVDAADEDRGGQFLLFGVAELLVDEAVERRTGRTLESINQVELVAR